jgi:hypothetical protein
MATIKANSGLWDNVHGIWNNPSQFSLVHSDGQDVVPCWQLNHTLHQACHIVSGVLVVIAGSEGPSLSRLNRQSLEAVGVDASGVISEMG